MQIAGACLSTPSIWPPEVVPSHPGVPPTPATGPAPCVTSSKLGINDTLSSCGP